MVTILVFGMPMAKVFNTNKDYKSINSLHTIEQNNQITTYSVGTITPEILWDYNGKLKDIYENGILTLPSAKQFGLLIANEDVEKIEKELSEEYQLSLLDTYNLNTGSKQKERLIRKFYLVTKK